MFTKGNKMLLGIGDYEPPEIDLDILFYCDECSDEIYEGETYYEIYGGHFCERCIEEARK